METKKCHVCLKEYERETMIEIGSLLDDSITFTCSECFADEGEIREEVGEGRPQSKLNKFMITVNGKGNIEVESISEKSAFQFVQTLDEFKLIVLEEIERDNEVHIQVEKK